MKIVRKFNNLIYNKQKYKFHDSTLLNFEINFEHNTVTIVIEFYKTINTEYGNLINIKFYFKEIKNSQLYNGLNYFGIDGDVYSFTINEDKDIGSLIKLTGSKGWEICFSVIDFEYEEEFKKKVEL